MQFFKDDATFSLTQGYITPGHQCFTGLAIFVFTLEKVSSYTFKIFKALGVESHRHEVVDGHSPDDMMQKKNTTSETKNPISLVTQALLDFSQKEFSLN